MITAALHATDTKVKLEDLSPQILRARGLAAGAEEKPEEDPS